MFLIINYLEEVIVVKDYSLSKGNKNINVIQII